ncbi:MULTISPECIES: glycosyltransferase family 2 protein [Bacillus]|uniref:glycosyltransferase family 2 protein n=1 Tax=Bacillus TaxID=1386 RepID=UPI000BB874A6|nr:MULTISPECIES: glycosyltransferase family 2 protein [Bacillus]
MFVVIGVVTVLLGWFLIASIPTFQDDRKNNVHTASLEELTIIIPARNEETNIKVLLESLLPYRNKIREILVMDDHSSDGTAEVAKMFHVDVISIPQLPKGWFGKAWGLWNGAQVAKGNYFMFLDADTWVQKGGLEKILAEYKGSKSVISIQPYHVMKSNVEKLSSFFHLVIMSSLGSFHLFRKHVKTSGAFGQVMLIGRKDYFVFGGHEKVKSELMENLSFAKIIQQRGGKVYCFSGKGAIEMRMYTSKIGSLVAGWGKSFATGAVKTNLIYLALVSIWISGLFTVVTNFSFNLYMKLFFYFMIVIHLRWSLAKVGNFGWGTAFLYPVHLMFFLLVFLYSSFITFGKKKGKWKGREIVIEEKVDKF